MNISDRFPKGWAPQFQSPSGKRYATRVGLTGTPGTGKKTIGRELARLADLEFLSINEVAIELGLGKWRGKEFVVDLKRLAPKISTENKLVVGHLLPYLVPSSKLDFVAVLRCSPLTLKERYQLRNYSEAKIRENLEAELIGVVEAKCLEVYGAEKVAEYDTSRAKSPQTIAKNILYTIQGKRKKITGEIDWLSSKRTARFLKQAELSCGNRAGKEYTYQNQKG